MSGKRNNEGNRMLLFCGGPVPNHSLRIVRSSSPPARGRLCHVTYELPADDVSTHACNGGDMTRPVSVSRTGASIHASIVNSRLEKR